MNRWLLTDILKHDWQHEGFIVSDLGGVKSMTAEDAVAPSLMVGCDFSDKEFQDNIPAAERVESLRFQDLSKRYNTTKLARKPVAAHAAKISNPAIIDPQMKSRMKISVRIFCNDNNN